MAFKILPFAGAAYPGDYADNTDFKQYFGFGAYDKWPTHALPDIQVPLARGGTTTMSLLPATEVGMRTRWCRTRQRTITVPVKTSKHRCFVICPDCGKHVPAGRTNQHKCKA